MSQMFADDAVNQHDDPLAAIGGCGPSWTLPLSLGNRSVGTGAPFLTVSLPCYPSRRVYFSLGIVISGEATMPLSSLRDPTDLARAYAVMDAAWNELKDAIPEDRYEEERTRLAYLVASLTPLALDQDDLKQNVLMQFREKASDAIDRLAPPATTC